MSLVRKKNSFNQHVTLEKFCFGQLKLNIDDIYSREIMFLNKTINILRYLSVDYHYFGR